MTGTIANVLEFLEEAAAPMERVTRLIEAATESLSASQNMQELTALLADAQRLRRRLARVTAKNQREFERRERADERMVGPVYESDDESNV